LSSLLGGSAGASGGQNAQNGLLGLFNTLGDRAGFSVKEVKKEILQPTLRQEAKREKLWFGPFKLPGINVNALSTLLYLHGVPSNGT
jgi:hypothetical protein